MPANPTLGGGEQKYVVGIEILFCRRTPGVKDSTWSIQTVPWKDVAVAMPAGVLPGKVYPDQLFC